MVCPTIKARPSSATSPAQGKYSAEKDDFELTGCRAHVIRKADYKSAGNGQLIKTTWSARLKTVIAGNTAEARYYRASYEASQRTSAALFSEEYKGESEGRPVDLADSTVVKSRFYRQDNLRFNPHLVRPEFGLSEKDKRSVKFSRWAHRANGVTELGAAPTGLFLKSTKLAFQPKQKDSSFSSQLRVFGALFLAVGFVSSLSRGLFTEVGGWAIKKLADGVRQNVGTVIFSFSAVAAVAAITSLAFGACSAIVGSRSRLSGVIMDSIQFNKDRHLHRIFLLIKDVKDKPDAIDLLTRALQKKIGKAYRVDDRRGTPILLERLLAAIDPTHNDTQMKRAIAKAIGSYLTEVNPKGDTEGQFLDSETDKSELLARENHFLALTNLIEHHAIQTGKHKYYMDVRHQVEKRVENVREGALKRWTEAKERRAEMSPDSNNAVERRTSKSLRYDSRNILDNPHQYGPLTRGLAKAAEVLRFFNHDIVLSLNYQVTRPVAQLAGDSLGLGGGYCLQWGRRWYECGGFSAET